VFSTIPKLRADALAMAGEPFFDSQRDRIVALSRQHGIPACYPWREYVLAGGLMSYGTSLPDTYRQAAVYVGRILKGEKPADFPSCNLRNSRWRSTSRLQRHLAWTCRQSCSPRRRGDRMIRRRDFITLLGGAAAWPVAARAQQPTMPATGYLSGASMTGEAGIQQGLKETGLVEGRDFRIENRSTAGQMDRLPAIVADVVGRRVSVILAVSDSFALAAKAATSAIPIVYIGGNDPVRIGLVSSLSSPGGNVTGVTVLNVEIAAKRLQLLNELIPTAPTIAALLDPATPNLDIDTESLLAAAKVLGLQVHILRAGTPAEVSAAIETIARRRLGPVVVGPSPFFNTQGKQLAAHMVRHSLPAIFQTREFAADGGLVSYGGSLLEAFRIAGTYTGRILKGDKPANLPVQQVSKFELFINLGTAKTLGLTVPDNLLARADEVIE
jgi:putative tryptophan/tyrosine transport system substrate-binding protein